MSTPIRLIAKKALSPNIYKSPNSQNFFKSPTFVNKPKFTRSTKPKSLTYFNELDSPNEKQINVPKNEVLPLINTPERNEILENGFSHFKRNILGRGTFGTVFQALYKNEKVAMKLIKNKSSTLLRESNAIKLNHKNIIKILRVSNDDNYNHAMIVMQHCSQFDLQELLENNYFPVKQIAQWALNICEALMFCHQNGVLHLDVKPKNILLKNNECILCDFGNSLNLNDEMQKQIYLEQFKNELCGGGTVLYTAPELFCIGQKFNLPTFSADIYSFGITIWQIENRNIPYGKMDNVHCIIYAVVKNGLRPEISNKLEYKKIQDLYIKCWNSLPEKRLSLFNIRNELLQIINENN